MAKKPESTRKTGKRSLKKAPATNDPTAAADAIVRRQAARAAKREFDAAHAKGMRALRSGNIQAVDIAIKQEARAIKKLATASLQKPIRRHAR